MLSYTNLAVHMQTNLSFKNIPGMSWSIDEIESLTPFEKEMYLTLINEDLKAKRERQRK